MIKLRPDLAPGHVERITELAQRGLLRRGGVPPRDRRLHGAGRRSDRHRHERSDKPDLKADSTPSRTCAAPARWPAPAIPNSANSQFFICLDDARFLDKQYTVWGQVESGMEHVDALPKGEPPREPGKIVKATVA